MTSMMGRREFVAGMAAMTAPLPVAAQPASSLVRIGMLRSEDRPADDPSLLHNLKAFRSGLQAEGYTDRQSYRIDYRSPKTEADLPKLAHAMVSEKVNVIHATGFIAIRAAQSATKTIPIIAHDYESDPIAAGFAATLAKPGSNITGMFLDLPEITGKLLELLKTAIPGIGRVAVLWDPHTGKAQRIAVEQAASTLPADIEIFEGHAATLEQTVHATKSRNSAARLLLLSPVFAVGHLKIATAAIRMRLPSIGLFPNFARMGGLMAYGPESVEQFWQEGAMVARILKGANPANMPIERPTRFYLFINLKTAKALGLTIPPSLLARADQVIE
jgi:ABC-type uncharacterized transport system substrate-binding protein